jgi:hypothetical protein
MRFLLLVMNAGAPPAPRPRDPEHAAKVRRSIDDDVAAGKLLATGGLAKRATGAARVTSKGGEIEVEDPPAGDGWMSAGGFALIEAASKDEAIARAKAKLAMMGDGVVELIQVSETHPPARESAG